MKRLARHLFTLCAAVSLVVCVAVCVLWVRSIWRYDSSLWRWSAPDYFIYLDLGSGGGQLVVQCVKGDRFGARPLTPPTLTDNLDGEPSTNHLPWDSQPLRNRRYQTNGRSPRFHAEVLRKHVPYTHNPSAGMDSVAIVAVAPHWFVAIATAVLPAYWLTRARHRRRAARAKAGLCPNCGYDLRASPDRCPECGAACSR